MTDWEITPYEGVGVIKFGMTQEEVRIAVKATSKEFKKNEFELGVTIAFTGLGVAAQFDKDKTCCAVEFYGPTLPNLGKKTFLGMQEKTLIQWLEENDPDAAVDPPDITSHKFGLAFYTPDDEVHSILVFSRGYFDE